MLPREASRRIRFLSLGVVTAGAMLALVMSCRPTTVSLAPELRPLFVRVTRGYVFVETPQGQDYMHRFYVRSSSLAPMSAPLFEQLEEWKVYRGALQRGTFTVCERSVAGSNAVLWIGYDSKIPLACTGAWYLLDRNGKKVALREMENHTLKNTRRHVWSAVCSGALQSGERYALQTDDRRILLLTAPK
jgi:hypothetical protein